MRFLRDGEGTLSYKKAKLFSNADDMTLLAIFQASDTESTLPQRFLASAIDGQCLMLAVDSAAPRLARAAYLEIGADVELLVDITSGDSSGGIPAQLEARVRVDGAPADREVVALERPLNGEWRVAGYGKTEAGEAILSLRVTGSGRIYTLSPDSWGEAFQPSLNVAEGDLIRPTVFMGWIYQVTQAGQLPAVEPAWWDDSLQGPQPLGTARAEVHRYYPPQGRGPIPVELT
ncbi:hypothetical protein [Pseudomonas sp. 273]|uniref:hypothetical protein n=1 Tax=Pseudomonas sp. 273 TaxID=75692 RepID=UPI0023D7CCCC|nr:hypothetical protein [Pseudomonas sp. 273]